MAVIYDLWIWLLHMDPRFDKNQVLNAYRLGRNNGLADRHSRLLVKFKDSLVKDVIVRKKIFQKNMKELSKFHCVEDLPDETCKVHLVMRDYEIRLK